jgi:hypothetical protein
VERDRGAAADTHRVRGIASRSPRARIALLAVAVAGLAAPATSASNLLDRNATNVRLQVNRQGMALVTYRVQGQLKHVLAWGAINAHAPTASVRQVSFKLDYSGGWSLSHKLPLLWERFKNVCGPYRGPALAWLVAACTARDGSSWALQSWQRMLPNYGIAATDPSQTVWELRLSHWKGPLAAFTVKQDWAYARWENIFGSYLYRGQPMFGFHTNVAGAPLDNYGVLVYVDTLNSAYGRGWRRENSFVTHNPTGIFCYGFFPHSRHPSGMGEAYRATVVGAGALPDQTWQSASLGPYDASRDTKANAERKALYSDRLCSYN